MSEENTINIPADFISRNIKTMIAELRTTLETYCTPEDITTESSKNLCVLINTIKHNAPSATDFKQAANDLMAVLYYMTHIQHLLNSDPAMLYYENMLSQHIGLCGTNNSWLVIQSDSKAKLQTLSEAARLMGLLPVIHNKPPHTQQI